MANNSGLDIVISLKGDTSDLKSKLTGLGKDVVKIQKDADDAAKSIISFSTKSSDTILKALDTALAGAKKGSAEYKLIESQIRDISKATMQSATKEVKDYESKATQAYKNVQTAAQESASAAQRGSKQQYQNAKIVAQQAMEECDAAMKSAEDDAKRIDELAGRLGTKTAENLKQQADATLNLVKSQKQAINEVYNQIIEDQAMMQAKFAQNMQASLENITGGKVTSFYIPTEEESGDPFKIVTETQEGIGKVRQTIYELSQDTGEYLPVSEKVIEEFTKQNEMANSLADTLMNLSTKNEKLAQDSMALTRKTGETSSVTQSAQQDAERLRELSEQVRNHSISIEEASRHVQAFGTRLTENQNQLAQEKTSVAEMTDSYDNAAVALDKLQNKLRLLEGDITAAENNGKTLKGTYDEVKYSVTDLIEESEKIKNSGLTGQDFVTKVREVANRVDDVDVRFKNLKKTAEQLPMSMEDAKKSVIEMKGSFAQLSKDLNGKSGDYAPAVFNSLKKEIADARKELETLSKKKVLSEDEIRRVAELKIRLKEYRAEIKETIADTPKVGQAAKTAFEKAKEGINPLVADLIVLRSKLVEIGEEFADNRTQPFIDDIDRAITSLQGLGNSSDKTYIQQQHLFNAIQQGKDVLNNGSNALKVMQVSTEKLAMTQDEAEKKARQLENALYDLDAKVDKSKLGYAAGTFNDVEQQIYEAKRELQQLNTEFANDGNLLKYINGLRRLEGGLEDVTTTYKREVAEGIKTATGDNFWQNMGKYARWYFGGNMITSAKRQVQEALNEMKAVDAELIQVKKVTDASDAALKKMGERAYEVGKKYGVAASEYLKAVAAYSRAGMKDTAEELAELSQKAALVGDMAQEDATKMFLALQKSYDLTTEELSAVLDGLNELDNKHATTIEGITEGLGKVASLSQIAHVGVDELSAAIGTITAVTQRSGTEAATALRALFLNIIGNTKMEIEDGETATIESINNIKDALKKYAPEVVEYAAKTKTVIDPLKAMEALSKAWKSGAMTEQNMVEIFSGLGGKLRTTQLAALVQHWDEYVAQIEHFNHAFESADKEVGNALGSWERKVQILKNTWTEFIAKSVETDMIKKAIDAVTSLINWIGDLRNGLVGLAGVITAIKLDKIVTSFKNGFGILKEVGGFLTKSTPAVQGMGEALQGVGGVLDQTGGKMQKVSGLAGELHDRFFGAASGVGELEGAEAAEGIAAEQNGTHHLSQAAKIGIARLAILALTAAVMWAIQEEAKYEQALEDNAENSKTAAESSKKESDQLILLWRAYKYCEIGSGEQMEASKRLAEVLDAEGTSVKNLRKEYAELTLQKLKDAENDAKMAAIDQGLVATTKYQKTKWGSGKTFIRSSQLESNVLFDADFAHAAASVEAIYNEYAEQGKILKEVTKSGETVYRALDDTAESLGYFAEATKKAQGELDKQAVSLGVDKGGKLKSSDTYKLLTSIMEKWGNEAYEFQLRQQEATEATLRREAYEIETNTIRASNIRPVGTGRYTNDEAMNEHIMMQNGGMAAMEEKIAQDAQAAYDYVDNTILRLKEAGDITEDTATVWKKILDDYADPAEIVKALEEGNIDFINSLIEGYGEVEQAVEEAKSAVDRFNDAIKEKNTDALEAYVKIYKEIMEAANKGAYGSVQFQEGAKALFTDEFIAKYAQNGDWAGLAKEMERMSVFLSDSEGYATGLYEYFKDISGEREGVETLADGTVRIADGLLTISKNKDGTFDWNLDADTVEEAATAIEQLSKITGIDTEVFAAIFQGWTDFAPGLAEIFKNVNDYLVKNNEETQKNKEKTAEVKTETEAAKTATEEQKQATAETKTEIQETAEAEAQVAESAEEAAENFEKIDEPISNAREETEALNLAVANTADYSQRIEKSLETINLHLSDAHTWLVFIDELVRGIANGADKIDFSKITEALEALNGGKEGKEGKEGELGKAIEITVTADTSEADEAVAAVDELEISDKDFEVSDAGSMDAMIAKSAETQAAIDAMHGTNITSTHTIVTKYVTEGSPAGASAKASGTDYFEGGAAFINDEPGGFNPELVVSQGKAYIYNSGEPALVDLPRGAKIYNADETRKILSGGNKIQEFQRFYSGTVPGNLGKKDTGSGGGGSKKTKDKSSSSSDDKDENKWFDLLKEYMEELYEEAERALDDEKEAITAQILALKYQTEAAEKANELEEKRLEMIQAENDLLDAQHERTVRYFNAETNQWEWMADQRDVLAAQEKLADAQKDYLDAQYDYLEDLWKKIEDEIDDYLEEKNELDIEEILDELKNSAAGSTLGSVNELIQLIKDFTSSPTSGMELKQIAAVYDSGGIATGKGFMPKGNLGKEIVLDSVMAGRILSPTTSGEFTAFTQNLASLLDMSSAFANPQSLLNKLSNVTNNNGGNTYINGVQIGSDYMNKPLSEVLSVLGIYANA